MCEEAVLVRDAILFRLDSTNLEDQFRFPFFVSDLLPGDAAEFAEFAGGGQGGQIPA